jgi:hypothetical protein
VSVEGDEREQAEQGRGGAADRQVRTAALRASAGAGSQCRDAVGPPQT